MELELPRKLRKAIEREAQDANLSVHAHIIKKLERVTPPAEYIDTHKIDAQGIEKLVSYLRKIPSVSIVSYNVTPDAFWWVKFDIDIDHRLAWNVVQELGFVLNYISIQELLPTVFKPVSPPPYLNGGPAECLSWVIESTFNYIDPGWIADTLAGRLPQPVENEAAWPGNDDGVQQVAQRE